MKKMLVLVGLCLLTACADPIDDAREAVKNKAVNPRGIEYREIQVARNDVVCGEFMEQERWGEGPGFQKFIVREGEADIRPSDTDVAIFCSEDPAAALNKELGIGPVKKDNANLVKIYADLSRLATALEDYRSGYSKYPSQATQNGLLELTKPPRGSPDPKASYIAEIPQDPWGRDYTYRVPRILHGAKDKYELFTLGKDGKSGGEGENADVGAQHLPYLDHVGGL